MGSKAYNQTLDFKAYNVGPVESEFFNKHRNGCFVVVLEQKSGDNRVIGTKKFPARFASLEDTSGTNNESAKNWTGQLVASPGHVAPFYTGAIDLTA
jgi:hypothetical protein